jgi:hypothetical protein
MRGASWYLAGILAVGTVLAGTAAASADTGSAAPGARAAAGGVGGLVWFDRDADRVRDRAEPGASGVVVTATNARTGQRYQATTDRAGNYLIAVPAGVYDVSADDTGYQPTTREDQRIQVVSGRASAANYGIRGGSISGLAWYDQNKDGVRQAAEPRISGVPVTAVSSRGVAYRTVTDRNGGYTLNDLAAGDYVVRFAKPSSTASGFTQPFIGDARTDSNVQDMQRGYAYVRLGATTGGVQDAKYVDAGYVRS